MIPTYLTMAEGARLKGRDKLGDCTIATIRNRPDELVFGLTNGQVVNYVQGNDARGDLIWVLEK